MKNRYHRGAFILTIAICCFSLFCVFDARIACAQQIDGESQRLFDLLLDLIRGTGEEIELTMQSLKTLAQSSSQEQAELVTMISRLDGISRDFQASFDLLSRLTQQKTSLESIQKVLLIDFQGFASKLNALENETQILKNYLRSSEDTLVRLQKEQGRPGAGKSGVLEESKRLVRELYDTNQHSRELNQKYEALKSEYDNLTAQLFSGGDKSKDISGPREQIALQLKTRQQELEKITEELARTNTFIAQYQTQIAALETRKKQMTSVVEKEQELAGLAGQILQVKVSAENALNQARIQKDQEISQLKFQKEAEANKLRVQKDEQIAQLTAQLNELKSQKEKERAQYKAEQEAEANKWKLEKEQEFARINGQLAGMRSQKDALTDKLNTQLARNNELLQVKAQKEQEIFCLNAQISQLKTEKEKGLQQIAGQKEKETAQLKAQKEEETAKLNVQLNLNAQLAQEKNAKGQELALCNRKLIESQEERKKLNEAYDQLNVKKESEILSLNNKIGLLEKELMSFQESVRQMTQERAIFVAGQNQSDIKIKSLETQIAELKSANEKLNQQNTFLKDDYVATSENAANIKKEAGEMAKEKDAALAKLKQAESRRFTLETIQQKQARTSETGKKTGKNDQRIPAERTSLQQEYQKLQQQYEALRQDNQSLKMQASESPKDAILAHYNLGVLYTQNKDYKRAIKEFEKVLEYKPDDADSHYNLGVIYGEYMSDRKKGLEYFEKYLNLAPSDADSEQVRKYILTWETLERQ
jgi:chromosome segregation ATPase